MFSKVLILALAAVANCQLLKSGLYGSGLGLYGAGLGVTGGIPVYRSSANYGGLYAANGWGYGANLGRVAGLGALRTSGAILGGGALGYGTGALVAGGLAPAVSSYGLGLGYGLGSVGYGLGSVGYTGASLGNLNIARGLSVSQAGPVNAAVQTISRTVDYRPVPYTGEAPVVQDIDVPPQESPLRINFQSKSSPLAVTQQHIPAEPGQVQVTQSEDEPQQVIHNVVRPVVQQVNEVVQPYRTLTQTVEPVIEQTHTNIAQGEGVRLSGLTTGVVGGTGVLAASGVGIAAPALGYGLGGYRTAVAAPAGVIGLGGVKAVGGLGLGLSNAGLYGSRYLNSGLVGSGLVGSGLVGSRLVGSGLIGSGLYGAGLYGTGLRSYGLGSGLALNGLSGLSASKILRY
jgi:hypothetical protein